MPETETVREALRESLRSELRKEAVDRLGEALEAARDRVQDAQDEYDEEDGGGSPEGRENRGRRYPLARAGIRRRVRRRIVERRIRAGLAIFAAGAILASMATGMFGDEGEHEHGGH